MYAGMLLRVRVGSVWRLHAEMLFIHSSLRPFGSGPCASKAHPFRTVKMKSINAIHNS